VQYRLFQSAFNSFAGSSRAQIGEGSQSLFRGERGDDLTFSGGIFMRRIACFLHYGGPWPGIS